MCWSMSSETALLSIVGWVRITEPSRMTNYWSLHVWNWHEGGQADDIHVVGEGCRFLEIFFLTKEKLLALTTRGHIELYDVEDLSKAPQLQARFALPFYTPHFAFRYPSVFHSASSCAHLVAPDERWIWTTNPADRVMCMSDYSSGGSIGSIFVITAGVFFMNIPPSWFDTTSEDSLTVPWLSWGPQNSCCFRGTDIFGVGGSRVIWVDHSKYPDTHSLVHMMDFNPSAVARGIGKVVRERTTYPRRTLHHEQYVPVTTYLPYVEVVGEVMIDPCATFSVLLDEEVVSIFTVCWCNNVCVFPPDKPMKLTVLFLPQSEQFEETVADIISL
ncbi:uncharacterized protein EDB91DRAFT_757242 [Suillus paluster]|uniref:uncharacterized protein n=1 Tax=Suillus paluster TaxID=48578 RepID=UPI001B87F635|nr:uncharacterized protein EDB91DRAFT_757242 [Suillus paluster]KAG1749655.1 hypothetical protein EDB91DRAFT_757242 [Suillus paluster]